MTDYASHLERLHASLSSGSTEIRYGGSRISVDYETRRAVFYPSDSDTFPRDELKAIQNVFTGRDIMIVRHLKCHTTI